MFWLFETVQAHGHSHAVDIDDLYLDKSAFQKWSQDIYGLFAFLQHRMADLPDPIPLALLPDETRSLVDDISHPLAPSAYDKHYTLLENLFHFSPLVNSVLASVLVSSLTNLLLRFSPELAGSKLDFLVAFAEGSILGNVFLHLMPESYKSGDGWSVVLGFLTFCALDKALKIVAKSVGHVHTHTHSQAQPAPAPMPEPKAEPEPETKAETTGARKPNLRSRKKAEPAREPTSEREPTPEPATEEPSHDHDHTHATHTAHAGEPRSIHAFLNVAADFAHNITDGVALAAAFNQSQADGIMTFILMILHEVPHQFGDFALLVQGGASKTTGLHAQVVASSGTLLGCFLFGAVSSHASLQWLLDAVTPFTAGVFLYIATVGVLPEILEVNGTSTKADVRQSLIQAVGILVGLGVMSYFS